MITCNAVIAGICCYKVPKKTTQYVWYHTTK